MQHYIYKQEIKRTKEKVKNRHADCHLRIGPADFFPEMVVKGVVVFFRMDI
jgi:hypothetical protein